MDFYIVLGLQSQRTEAFSRAIFGPNSSDPPRAWERGKHLWPLASSVSAQAKSTSATPSRTRAAGLSMSPSRITRSTSGRPTHGGPLKVARRKNIASGGATICMPTSIGKERVLDTGAIWFGRSPIQESFASTKAIVKSQYLQATSAPRQVGRLPHVKAWELEQHCASLQ